MRTAALLTLLLVAPAPAADLAARIAALVDTAPTAVRGSVGVSVVDLATNKVVYAHNEDQLFLPASNMKLFTAALALTRLGPDYRFETRLLREPSGSLILTGSGDPSLSGRAYPYRESATPGNPLQAIEDLADQAVAAGLHSVDGDIAGDDRRYAWSPYPESWTADDIEHDYGAPVSALTLDDNIVTLSVRPGARPGDLARIDLIPAVEYFAIDNRVTTGPAPTSIQLKRLPGTRQLLLTGTIRTGAPPVQEIAAVDDPALFAARALYDALLRRGVIIRGGPIARHDTSRGRQGQGTPSVEGEILARHSSPRLADLLQTAIKISQNLHMELLLREVGVARQNEGSLDGGLREMAALLDQLKLTPADWRAEDASGLARNDQVTARAMTQLLTFMASQPGSETWFGLLPVGGQDGTLSNRLCCTSDTVQIRAKTGTLSRAVTLSGYAASPRTGRLAFSILLNNFGVSPAEARAWVDKVATALVE